MRPRRWAKSNDSAGESVSSDGLWTAFARGVRDNLAAEGVVQVLRVGGMIVLVRALSPEDFGLFRVLLVVSVIAGLSNQTGIPDALIQRRNVSPEHVSTAWWLSAVIAIVSSVGLYALAPFISEAMEMPSLTDSVRILCIPIFLEGTAVTAGACLRRQLKFGALAIADVVAEVAFLGSALAILEYGQPAWCLPGALAARMATHALAIWIAEPRLPTTLPTRTAASDFVHFTRAVWSGQFLYVVSSNADFILVGRLLGTSALGYYSIAWDLLRFVPDRLHRVAGRVALPAFCRLQDDQPALSSAYLEFFAYIARIVLPIAAFAAVAAPEILSTVYGNKWLSAALPMRLLAPGLALCGLRLGMGAMFYAKNRPVFDFYLHGARLTLIVITVLILSRWGLPGVSGGMSAVEFTISIVGQSLASSLAGVRLHDLAFASSRACRITVLCVGAALCGRTLMILMGLEPAAVLAAGALSAALVYIWLEGADAVEGVKRMFGPGARTQTQTAPSRP